MLCYQCGAYIHPGKDIILTGYRFCSRPCVREWLRGGVREVNIIRDGTVNMEYELERAYDYME
jgi:hypothetical protein